VAVLDISLGAARRTADGIDLGAAFAADVSDSDQVDAAVEQIEADLGPVRIFVNNAGAVGLDHVRRVTPLLERQREETAAVGRAQTPLDALGRLTDEEWRFVLSTHLDGTFYCTRAASRAMARHGHGGAIVNMASICGIEGCTGHPHYSAAKAGILGFTRSVAKELIVQDIRVNAVAPGFIDTSRLKTSLGANRQAELMRTPAGRLGTPDEVAATVAFLVSEDASYFVGATLSPNGGLLTAA
jgi:3-oxoacyl-[acyl-carrier protein] reductase